MPTLTFTKPWAASTTPTEAQIDTIRDEMLTFLNDTKITTANIQDDGITASSKFVALSIPAEKIADNAITRAKQAAKNFQQGSSTTQSCTATSYTDVSGLSVNITTTGRPVFIWLNVADSNASYIAYRTNNGTAIGGIKLLRGSTEIARWHFRSDDTTTTEIPPGYIRFIDTPSAALYTYKIQAFVPNGADVINFNNIKLSAMEW